jgi:hypothetical protein
MHTFQGQYITKAAPSRQPLFEIEQRQNIIHYSLFFDASYMRASFLYFFSVCKSANIRDTPQDSRKTFSP